MKSQVVVFALFAGAVSSFAQGSLTPPGAPGQTMKSLDQIEARTVIPGGTTGYIISTPGSYVLGGNLTISDGAAIVINSGNVTLDLNGFTLFSTPALSNGVGIRLTGSIADVRIFNGHIVGSTIYDAPIHTFEPSGFDIGILAAIQLNVEIDHISVSGMKQIGISAPEASIHDCSVTLCADDGIVGTQVLDCRVNLVGGSGIIGSNISRCHGETVGHIASSDGISGQVVTDCYGWADMGVGINSSRLVQNSTGGGASGAGISAETVSVSHGTSYSGTGITTKVASYSYGSSTTGTAINATRSAIGCSVGTGAVVSPNKLLGTP